MLNPAINRIIVTLQGSFEHPCGFGLEISSVLQPRRISLFPDIPDLLITENACCRRDCAELKLEVYPLLFEPVELAFAKIHFFSGFRQLNFTLLNLLDRGTIYGHQLFDRARPWGEYLQLLIQFGMGCAQSMLRERSLSNVVDGACLSE